MEKFFERYKKNQLILSFLRLKNSLLKVVLAIVIMLIAGPEIIAGMELYALVEVLGATTFLSIYFSYLKYSTIDFLSKFEITGFGSISLKDVIKEPKFVPFVIPFSSALYSLLYLGPVFIILDLLLF